MKDLCNEFAVATSCPGATGGSAAIDQYGRTAIGIDYLPGNQKDQTAAAAALVAGAGIGAACIDFSVGINQFDHRSTEADYTAAGPAAIRTGRATL